MSTDNQSTTDFGFQQIPKQEKVNKVAAVFHSVATQYDIMNDLMSLGIHRLWKQFTIQCSGARSGQSILDLAGGTGDLAAKYAKIVGTTGQVFLADINESMLKVGREKLHDRGIINNLDYLQLNAEQLPFAKNTFDLVNISFGLRNVTDKQQALTEMYRILKPGARVLILEFSKPTHSWLAKTYDHYSFSLLPKLGQLVAQDGASYQYLAESIRMHPDQETLSRMMTEAGFEQVSYTNLTGGIVALHRGFKF